MGVPSLWTGLLSKTSALIPPSSVPTLDPSAHPHTTTLDHMPKLPTVSAVGAVTASHAQLVACMDRGTAARASRFIQLAAAASHEAILDAGFTTPSTTPSTTSTSTSSSSSIPSERTGVAIGSGMGSPTDVCDATLALYDPQRGPRRISPFMVPRSLVNLAAGTVSIMHGLQGPNHAVATACATGAHALGDAANLIALDYADVMVAGSSEAGLDPLFLTGFARAKALSTSYTHSPESASRPFDQGRDGFVMGEGAGVVILEEYHHAVARGAKIYAELVGYGLSGDAHHITAPAPDGNGAQRAMKMAIERGNRTPANVVHINAHATSTPLGDAVEHGAIAAILESSQHKASPPRSHPVPVSSAKGAIGHLLGASGSVEAIAAILSVYHKTAPPTTNLTVRCPEIPESDAIHLNTSPVDLSPVIDPHSIVLSNSFGFGGTNVTLAFSPSPTSRAAS